MAGQELQRRPAGNAARIEELRTHLLGRADDLTRALAGSIDAQKFVDVAITAIATLKDSDMRAKVLACTTESLTLAVVQAAQAGLRIDGRQSTLIPYGQTAQWTPMVKGRIDLILRVPAVRKVVTRVVLDADEFEYQLGTEEKIWHRPNLDPPSSAKLTHSYAIVTYQDGTQVFEVIGRARIDQIRAQFSKQPNGPAWKNSFGEMAQKCALNRVERLIDTDPDVARVLRHAQDAEFTLPHDDPAELATAKISEQVEQQREKLTRALAQPKLDVQNELRRVLIAKIGDAVKSQQLTREEGAKEVRAALQLAGYTEYPERGGAPHMQELSIEQLRAIVEHLEQLGPGFAAQDQQHPTEPADQPEPAGQNGQEAGQTAPESSEPATEPESQPERPAADPRGSVVDESAGSKVDPLICRQIKKQGKVHIGDPLLEKPPRCIGCGKEIGAQAGGNGFTAVPDWTRYCPDALDAVDQRYAAERVPDPILAALLVRARA